MWPLSLKRAGSNVATLESSRNAIPLRYDTVYGKRVVDRSYDIETARTLYTLEDGSKYYRYYDEDHFYPAAKSARSARNPSACPGCGSTNNICAHNCSAVFKYDEKGVLQKLVPNSTLGFDHTCSKGKCITCRRIPEKCQCGAFTSFQSTKERLREHARLLKAQQDAKAEADHICNLLEQIRNKPITRHDSILGDFDRRWRAEIERKNIGRVVQQIALEIARLTAEYREANAIHAMREFETQGRFLEVICGKHITNEFERDLLEAIGPADDLLQARIEEASRGMK